jgi:hypothetical protein
LREEERPALQIVIEGVSRRGGAGEGEGDTGSSEEAGGCEHGPVGNTLSWRAEPFAPGPARGRHSGWLLPWRN